MQERRKLRIATFTSTDPEAIADIEHQGDDIATVAPGIGVVGFDHIAEEECRPSIRVAELERVVDPNLALPREHDEQAHERQNERDRDRVVDRDQRSEQADGRERDIDQGAGEHELGRQVQRNAVHELLPWRVDEVVDPELRAESA